jgi:hypothetical protein
MPLMHKVSSLQDTVTSTASCGGGGGGTDASASRDLRFQTPHLDAGNAPLPAIPDEIEC